MNGYRWKRFALLMLGVGFVVVLVIGVTERWRFPPDSASERKIELVSEQVRKYWEAHGKCPTLDDVEAYSLQITEVGLCPGVEDYPCISYLVLPVTPEECMLMYPHGLGGPYEQFVFLVIKEKWLNPDDYREYLERLNRAEARAASSVPE
jgi:hypothetical protein